MVKKIKEYFKKQGFEEKGKNDEGITILKKKDKGNDNVD